MKKKISISFVITLVLILSLGLSACGNNRDDVKDIDDFDELYGSYSYVNEPESVFDWRDLTGDDDMTVDGYFTESHYNGITPYVFSPGGGAYRMEIIPYFGTTGLYVKILVQDDKIYYNPAKQVHENSSVILYIAPDKGSGTTLNSDAIQIRMGVNGATEQYYGRPATSYGYARSTVPTMSRVKIRNGSDYVDYELRGLINLDTDVTGYDIECYVPYTSFGLDSKPNTVKMMTELNAKISYSEGRTCYGSAPYKEPAKFQSYSIFGYYV